MVEDIGDMGHFLHSKEGVTQGNPLAMLTYGIVFLPLILDLWESHPQVTHLWYADNTGSGKSFQDVQAHLDTIMVRGPPQGYFPVPTKSILVISKENFQFNKCFFKRSGLTIVTCSHYLGGYLGYDKP